MTSVPSSRCHPAAALGPPAPTTAARLHILLLRGEARGPRQQTGSTTCPPVWVQPGSRAAGTPPQAHPPFWFALLAVAQAPGPSPGPPPRFGPGSAAGGMGARRPLRGHRLCLALGRAVTQRALAGLCYVTPAAMSGDVPLGPPLPRPPPPFPRLVRSKLFFRPSTPAFTLGMLQAASPSPPSPPFRRSPLRPAH